MADTSTDIVTDSDQPATSDIVTDSEQQQQNAGQIRLAEMERIAEQAEQVRQGNPDAIDELDTPPQAPQNAPASPEPPAEQTVKVKIDGEERELPLSEVVKGYQMSSTASKRLEEAALARKALEEERARLQQQAPPQAPDADGDEPGDDSVVQALDSMWEGDRETAAHALRKALAESKGDLPDIAAEVQRQIAAIQAQQEFEAANRHFQSEFADVDADPILRGYAVDIYQQAVRDGKSHMDAAIAGGTAARDWLSGKIGAQQPSRTIDRSAAKARIDTVPVATGRATPGKDPNAQESASDVIAGMRKARGLTD